MDFVAVMEQAIALLRQRGRVTYRTLQIQFTLDDAQLAALKDELLYSQPQVRDDTGRGLLWTEDAGPVLAGTAAPVAPPAPAPLTYTPPYLAEKILTSRSALEGERKQVTVLFADLKGSMELLADRDPEEARQLLDPVLERMMAAVHRYEGTVNQVMGDGIMALFGAPLAHEDHAVRACYAALAMHAAIRAYAEEARRAHGITVQMRVGLNSGEVVVRAIGNDLHMDYTAVGQTTHLAARMEQLATPGGTLLTVDTLRLVEGLVQVTVLGPIPVKGLPEPVEVFELVGASTLGGRFQARVMGGLTRFVGREPERAALGQALERAGAGHGQVVAVVGEAGVGKSRFVYECVHAHQLHGWQVLESAAVSYGQATPYFPVIELLRRYTHIEERDEVRTIRAKVTGQVLTLDDALQDTLPALLALLDALPEDSSFHQLDPPQRRQRTLDGLKRVLLRESQAQPLVLVFEDLHWIDTETQALLDSVVDSVPTARLLLLVNYRPEYQHGWGSKTYYTQLRLDPLPPGNAQALLHALLGDDRSLEPLTPLLITRTEGNPFFLEESVRTLVETGVLVGELSAYHVAKPLESLHVPATVQAVLAARIDRLPPEEKRLLQTAAVIGTEVPVPLLHAIAEMPEAVLYSSLAHVQAAEFLYETRLFPEREYTFKHALTHEVAYGSLLLERRRVLHARVVEALETLAGDRLAEQVERLAHHAFRGERWAQACTYFRQAGAKAATRSAYREAVTCFEQALVALRHLPESQDTQTQGIDLRLELREVLHPLGAIEQMRTYLHEAETLAETVDDPQRLGRIYRVVCLLSFQTGDYGRGLTSGQRALAIGEALGDVHLQFSAHHHLGMNYHMLGDYGQASACLTTAVSLEGLVRAQPTSLPGVVAHRAWLSRSCAELGAFAEGLIHSDAGSQLAEADDLPYNRVSAWMGAGYLYHRQGDLPRAITVLERGVALCRVWQIHLLFPGVTADLGVVYALAGRVAEALPLLQHAVEQATVMRFMPYVSSGLAALSEGYLLAGRPDEALPIAHQASALARQHHEQGSQAWVLRLLGDIAIHGDPSEVAPAEAYYRQALALAEARGMRPLQAHCHQGLGTLYATISQQEQAHAALTTAIEMYRAMEMTFWLPQAEATLAQVQAR